MLWWTGHKTLKIGIKINFNILAKKKNKNNNHLPVIPSSVTRKLKTILKYKILFNLYIPQNLRLQNFFLNFRALDILVHPRQSVLFFFLQICTSQVSDKKTSTLRNKLLCFKDLFLVLVLKPILRFKLPKRQT